MHSGKRFAAHSRFCSNSGHTCIGTCFTCIGTCVPKTLADFQSIDTCPILGEKYSMYRYIVSMYRYIKELRNSRRKQSEIAHVPIHGFPCIDTSSTEEAMYRYIGWSTNTLGPLGRTVRKCSCTDTSFHDVSIHHQRSDLIFKAMYRYIYFMYRYIRSQISKFKFF